MRNPADAPNRACRDADTEQFFPTATEISAARQVIRTYCKPCPVRAECLEFALEVEGKTGKSGRAGIYGGTIPSTRAKIYYASVKAAS